MYPLSNIKNNDSKTDTGVYGAVIPEFSGKYNGIKALLIEQKLNLATKFGYLDIFI
ncbi:hypothetical protein CYANOKiyG1_58330 [Okeania sp. KiyG1]|nr:hypothetical protein CYANOKiyG1_58330 [Okeania sp. KiyG1]